MLWYRWIHADEIRKRLCKFDLAVQVRCSILKLCKRRHGIRRLIYSIVD